MSIVVSSDSILNFGAILHKLLEILLGSQVLGALVDGFETFFLEDSFGCGGPDVGLDAASVLATLDAVVGVHVTTFWPLLNLVLLYNAIQIKILTLKLFNLLLKHIGLIRLRIIFNLGF